MTATPPTRDQITALLALADKLNGPSISLDLSDHLQEFGARASDVFHPLAEAYLAGLDAADRARIEELEGMREWCFVGKNPVFFVYDAGHNNTLQSVIFELDRRIDAIQERKS
jgi:hypothetical protein